MDLWNGNGRVGVMHLVSWSERLEDWDCRSESGGGRVLGLNF